MDNQTVKMTLDLANQILGYLGKRPYEEVFTLINEFQRQYKENADLEKGVTFPREKLEAEEVDGTT
jgi:hypothetical protein